MVRIRHPKQIADAPLDNPGPLLKKFLEDHPDRTRADWHDVLAQAHRNYSRFMMWLNSDGEIMMSIPKERR